MKQKSKKIVRLYVADGFPECEKVRQYLKKKRIEFQEFNVGYDKLNAEEMIKISGQMGVPVIIVQGSFVVGFDPLKIDELLSGI